jgi:lipoyl(octanoyl) transferase
LAGARKRQEIPDTLLLLEHDPVITYGRNVGPESLLLDEATLKARGVELVEVDRGGDATFHGPGQLVAYPILDLSVDCKDVRRYVWNLEQAMLDVMAEYQIIGSRIDGAPGAWVPAKDPSDIDRKMGAVGVRLSRWVTHHGIGFNVNTDLSYFRMIVPCGLNDKGVTSLQRELAPHKLQLDEVPKLDFQKVERHFIRCFAHLFQRSVTEVSRDALEPNIFPTTST